MPNESRESRSRRRNHDLRPRHSTSYSSDSDGGSKRRKSRSRRTYKRYHSPNDVLMEQMQQIADRLTALEEQRRSLPPQQCEPSAGASALTPPRSRSVTATVPELRRSVAEGRGSVVPSSPERPASATTDRDASTTDRIIDAIRSINTSLLQTLTDSGFSINLKKCSFLSTKIEYLGRTISQGQVQPSEGKVQALVEAATPLILHLVRDIALENSHPNREALREMHRQRASERLETNRNQQDSTVNADRRPPRTFATNSFVFVIKKAQMTGKLDSGMRGRYRVVKALPHGRYELQLLAGSYGKATQAAAEFMVPWRGEWTPDTCAAFFEGADNDDDYVESTPEQTARSIEDEPFRDPFMEPIPGTSGSRNAQQREIREHEDVLQSGEAVLEE